jgi:2,3-bisphosphoglycerate-dependent phosphoglycerate mutase|tara:strand:+ start:19 stop:738 length:720 start_codon:yes stop_codon:yes gene_type:complete
MSKLILTRHGQSIWNAENRFTGWVDVDLSEKGILEAQKSGQLIKKLKINIDVSYTSYLKRAIKTLTTILQENNLDFKFNTSWEINERHYGSLTGLNKEETKKKIGEKQFKEYRRSWSIAPPPMNADDGNQSLFSPLNANIPAGMIPLTESLKDTYERVIPYYEKEIKKKIQENKNVLIAAHGNSLRALCKYLFKISDQNINELEIPTGNPLIVELDNNLEIKKYYYLDESRAKNIIFNQ